MENLKSHNDGEKSASIHKTKIEQAAVQSFLESHYKTPISDLVTISGGEGSQAFSFEINGEALILRVNRHSDSGFKKDRYAFEHFKSQQIPIPEVVEVGEMEDGQYFSISKKVEGSLFKNLSDEEFDKALPSLFNTLEAIHTIDISDKEGYGKWDNEGIADKRNWKEVLLNVNEYAVHMFDSSMLEKEVWDKAYTRLIDLLPFCSEEKYLVHGDYNFDNLFVKDEEVVGVIDWEGSMYGDFLYDIARLQFFAKDFDYEKAYLEFSNITGKKIENFEERVLCYKLYLGLGSLSFYAYSKQEDKYERSKEKLLKLIGE
ncbi:MAG TPA: aminoglycoside phosphotransferase family protein [bacterium]|nr:aminoglycoside phosphotransferase family protein [bacterium]